jgi:hypothetical protein
MTRYEVQFELPVDNPVNNVGKCVHNGVVIFCVPLNHPDAHIMGYADLIAAAQLSGRLVLFTALNNKNRPKKDPLVPKVVGTSPGDDEVPPKLKLKKP